MAFDMTFPYTDMHTLNLDWILRKLKELENGGGSDEDLTEFKTMLRNIGKCLNGGVGILAMDMENLTGAALSNNFMYREKTSSSLMVNFTLTNNTGSTISNSTALIKLPFNDPDLVATNLRGITVAVVKNDGTVEFGTLGISYNSVLDAVVLRTSLNIPDGASLYVNGTGAASSCVSPLINRGKYDATTAAEICTHFLFGTTADPWAPGDFTYSQNNAVRLDPTNRQTDCSGMVYIAYHTMGLRPGKGTVVDPYFSDGMVIAYADVGEDLDLSNALPGDVIVYHVPGDSYDTNHCSLYAGNNVTYEMNNAYPAKEQAAGCVNGRGPYAITSTPASEYRKEDRGRWVVRFL